MKPKTTESENLHKEHRIRVKERFLRGGLDQFSPHELLELILFYAVPQKDTNELGHRLIRRFGSLSRVFRASKEELCRVDGIGEHAATLLRLWMPAAAYVLTDEHAQGQNRFSSLQDVGTYFVSRYIGQDHETVYLMLLDNRRAMLDCVAVHSGSVNSVSITPRRLIEIAVLQGAAAVVLAHNHPSGIPIPSGDDINTTIALRDAFERVGIPLLEHLVVAGGSFAPIILRMSPGLAQCSEIRRVFYANYNFEEPT